MNNLRTVSDTKRDFYSYHTRPINSIYRRVVEELMVEMHLLSVNLDFRYDPVYALGVVTSFERFMQGYRPEADQGPIFDALVKALGADAQQYRTDAQRLEAQVKGISGQGLIERFQSLPSGGDEFRSIFEPIANNPRFKYSRLFAIGLYTLLEMADPELAKDEKQRTDTLKQICEALHLPEEKLRKDLDLYRSNLDKMAQIQTVLQDALNADRKKREQRTQDKAIVDSQT